MRLFRVPAAACLLALLAGCGGGGGKYPVSGKVVYDDGSPATDLAGAEVVFESQGTSARGEIGPDGRFELHTEKPGDGVLPGAYKVAVVWEADTGEERGGGKAGRRRRPFPQEYTDPATTPLSRTVEAKSNDLTITLPRAGK